MDFSIMFKVFLNKIFGKPLNKNKEWQTYSYTTFGFSVAFPQIPQVSTKYPLTNFMCLLGKDNFAIQVQTIGEVSQEKAFELVNTNLMNIASNAKAYIDQSKKVEFQGLEAIEVDVQDGSEFIKNIGFYNNGNIYFISAGSSTSDESNINKFITSFKLLEENKKYVHKKALTNRVEIPDREYQYITSTSKTNHIDKEWKELEKQERIERIGNALLMIGGVVFFIIFFWGRIGSFIDSINIPNTIQTAYSAIFKTTYDYTGWTPIENQYFSIQFPNQPIADTTSGYTGWNSIYSLNGSEYTYSAYVLTNTIKTCSSQNYFVNGYKGQVFLSNNSQPIKTLCINDKGNLYILAITSGIINTGSFPDFDKFVASFKIIN